jgi:hypothetical protein
MPLHPFFDAPLFPWHRPEAEPFHLAVAHTLPLPEAPILLPRFGGNPLLLTPGQPPVAVWREVLEQLTVVRGLRGLCEWCRDNQRYSQNVPFQDAVRAVLFAVAAVERRVVADDGSRAVLDRSSLRTMLARLAAQNDDAKMLLVRGARKCGKSHSRHLLELAAQDRKAQVVYMRAGATDTVEEVVNRLGAVLEAEIDPPTTTDPAWYKQVINRLLRAARRSGTEWWIIMDDLGDDDYGVPLMDPRVREFFQQFGNNYPDPQFRQWFRLMLVDLPPAREATRWDRRCYLEDRPAEADITREHIAEALREGAQRRGKVLLAGELDALTAKVLATAETLASAPDAPCWLERVHDATVAALKDL